jgi:hypothetical protein
MLCPTPLDKPASVEVNLGGLRFAPFAHQSPGVQIDGDRTWDI